MTFHIKANSKLSIFRLRNSQPSGRAVGSAAEDLALHRPTYFFLKLRLAIFRYLHTDAAKVWDRKPASHLPFRLVQ